MHLHGALAPAFARPQYLFARPQYPISQLPRAARLHHVCCSSSAASSSSLPDDGSSTAGPSSSSSSGGGGGPLAWLKRAFSGSSKLDKQKLAEYGAGAFAAYGIISNINAGVLITIAWIGVVKQTGLTPLDAGMWPRFLGIYAGLYLTTNLLRPLRLTLALTVAPFFNRALAAIEARLNVNKAIAFGALLAAIAATSFSCITLAIIAAGGFPNGPPPLPWQR